MTGKAAGLLGASKWFDERTIKLAIEKQRANQLRGHCGNSKDFISGIHHDRDFDLLYVNMYRGMQPFPLRRQIQNANSIRYHKQVPPQSVQEQLR